MPCLTLSSAPVQESERVLVGGGRGLVAGVTHFVPGECGVYLVTPPKQWEFLSLSSLHVHGVPTVKVDQHGVSRGGMAVVTRNGHK